MRLSDLSITLYASWSSILAFSLRRKAPSKGNTADRRPIFPHAHEKARSTSRGHRALSALRAISWCFDSSVRQGSRGLLLHRHCVALAGRPRSHVAVQPSSVAPPLAPSSFFVCSQNLVSLDLDPQSPGWHTWVRKVSEHNTTTLHTFSIVFFVFLVLAQIRTHTLCACWHMFVCLPFAATCLFLDQLFLDCFANLQLPHSGPARDRRE